MLRQEPERQQSFYCVLYDKIPEGHILKQVSKAVDFGFVNELLEGSYCKNFGRPAKEPEMMMKLLFLEYLYNLSDVKVIEEASLNLVYLWFLGLNPEDKLPDSSLLAKFRTQRLKDITLDDVISEIVRQCVKNGLIKGDSLTVDTTHIEANCTKKVPERIMKHLAKRIFKGLEADNGQVPVTVNTTIPDYTQIEDHTQAKQTMKNFLEDVMESAAAYAGEATAAAIAEAKDVLSDEKFLLQKGLRSLSDKDARVGSKSKTSQFYGYKTELTMTADERIITAADTHSGEYVDGKEFAPLLERTQNAGVTVHELYGDKAYFRKDILEMLEKQKIKGYIPVSASVYKIDEELFSYNKDSDQWFCFMGNYTVSHQKKIRHRATNREYEVYSYLFKKEQCKTCPHREQCMGKDKKQARRLDVSASTPLFYKKSQEQKRPEFQEKYKKRSAQEWKNGEMKRFHGMVRARGWGLRSVSTQVKLTVIAVNLKRIAALVSSQGQLKRKIIPLILRIDAFFSNFPNSCHCLPKILLEIPTFSVVSNRPLSCFPLSQLPVGGWFSVLP